MVRVAYFSNQFADAQGHGLARYAREMFAGLSHVPDIDCLPVAAWSSLPADQLSALQQRTGLRLLPSGRRGTSVGWHFLNAPPLEWMVPGPIDVVHAVSLGYAVATRKPYVVTIHDLGPITQPQFFTNKKPYIMQRALAQAKAKAAAIVCVSDSTANEIEHVLGPAIAPRLHVVKEGVSPSFFEPVPPEVLTGLPLPEADVPVILSAGKISPRKNIQGLLDAFVKVLDQVPHHLVLVGGAGWEMQNVLDRLNDDRVTGRVHLLDYVSDEQLRALYRRAALYVHASLYEGFGLTVLEAMASGVPVITSNSSSLPEVAGNAAVLVDPKDTRSLADAIVALCEDETLAKQHSALGLARAREFSWDECAARLANVLKGAARS